jgi:hypothetical protein
MRSNAPKFTNSPPTAPDVNYGSSQQVGDILHEATSAASDAVSGAADAIKDRVEEAITYARENFSKVTEVALPRRRPSRRSNRPSTVSLRDSHWCLAP